MLARSAMEARWSTGSVTYPPLALAAPRRDSFGGFDPPGPGIILSPAPSAVQRLLRERFVCFGGLRRVTIAPMISDARAHRKIQ